jgi:hypothetical protein
MVPVLGQCIYDDHVLAHDHLVADIGDGGPGKVVRGVRADACDGILPGDASATDDVPLDVICKVWNDMVETMAGKRQRDVLVAMRNDMLPSSTEGMYLNRLFRSWPLKKRRRLPGVRSPDPQLRS